MTTVKKIQNKNTTTTTSITTAMGVTSRPSHPRTRRCARASGSERRKRRTMGEGVPTWMCSHIRSACCVQSLGRTDTEHAAIVLRFQPEICFMGYAERACCASIENDVRSLCSRVTRGHGARRTRVSLSERQSITAVV